MIHFEGYHESRARLWLMTRKELLDLLDALYGRPDGWAGLDDDYIRVEAIRQHARDWEIPERRRSQS